MADMVVHIGENSPEHVAYKLMERIAEVEDRKLHRGSGGQHKVADKAWILEYIRGVHSHRTRLQQPWRCGHDKGLLGSSRICFSRLTQQLRQLRYVGRNPPCFVLGEQLGWRAQAK
jgi:hypothetical protein